MKKLFVFCLTAILLMGLLTGCRRNVSDTENGVVDGTNSTKPTEIMPTTQATPPATRDTQPATQNTQPTTSGSPATENTHGTEGGQNDHGTEYTEATDGMNGSDTSEPTVTGRSRGRMPR